jgi:hypothetical protein
MADNVAPSPALSPYRPPDRATIDAKLTEKKRFFLILLHRFYSYIAK